MVRAATPATDFRTKGQLESGGHRVNRYHRMTFPDTSLPLTVSHGTYSPSVVWYVPDDPITDLIAKAIVNVTASGERNPKEVMDRALNALGVRRSAA
jgi:hypothetical protein